MLEEIRSAPREDDLRATSGRAVGDESTADVAEDAVETFHLSGPQNLRPRERTPDLLAQLNEITSWLSTLVTPGARHAARSASSFSSQERTLPLSLTLLPSTSTLTRPASSLT